MRVIGIAGAGTVGSALLRLLECSGAARAKAVLVRDVSRRREGLPPGLRLTEDPEEILADPEIGLAVELMGGTDAAFSFAARALGAGKHLVTANKNLIAERGPELFALARERGVSIGFEAAVCAGMPVIRAFQESFRADRVLGVEGILNGTCNYILTRMDEAGLGLAQAVAEAQGLGLAEPDPSYDLSGRDSACKLSILASLASGAWVDPASLRVEGIEGIEPEDIRQARRLSFRIRLLGLLRLGPEGGLEEACVGPALVPEDHPLASVRFENNALLADCAGLGPNFFSGRGAGPLPTATALLSDILAAAEGRGLVPGAGHPFLAGRAAAPEGKAESRRLLRLSPPPGAEASLPALLAAAGIGIESLARSAPRAGGQEKLEVATRPASARAFEGLARALEAAGWPRPLSLRMIEA